jgi:hypothetical protein
LVEKYGARDAEEYRRETATENEDQRRSATKIETPKKTICAQINDGTGSREED